MSLAKMDGVQNSLAKRFETLDEQNVKNITDSDIKRKKCISHS
jgi:hypothetical protein